MLLTVEARLVNRLCTPMQVQQLCAETGEEVEVRRYERFTPLQVGLLAGHVTLPAFIDCFAGGIT